MNEGVNVSDIFIYLVKAVRPIQLTLGKKSDEKV